MTKIILIKFINCKICHQFVNSSSILFLYLLNPLVRQKILNELINHLVFEPPGKELFAVCPNIVKKIIFMSVFLIKKININFWNSPKKYVYFFLFHKIFYKLISLFYWIINHFDQNKFETLTYFSNLFFIS